MRQLNSDKNVPNETIILRIKGFNTRQLYANENVSKTRQFICE